MIHWKKTYQGMYEIPGVHIFHSKKHLQGSGSFRTGSADGQLMDHGSDPHADDIFFEAPQRQVPAPCCLLFHSVMSPPKTNPPPPSIDIFHGDTGGFKGPKVLTVPMQVARHGDDKGGFQDFEILPNLNPKTSAGLCVCGSTHERCCQYTSV